MRRAFVTLLGVVVLAAVWAVWQTTADSATPSAAQAAAHAAGRPTAASEPAVAQGAALFAGEAAPGLPPLQGRMVGHVNALPAAATRCASCHSTTAITTARSAAAASSIGTPLRPDALAEGAGFGAVLNARTLGQAQPRRGGPPSAYDASSLCKLLREGIDPAWVLINTAMPRYDASDAQCAALWAWLMQQPGSE